EIANLRVSKPCHAFYRRDDLGISKIELRLLYCRLVGFNICSSRLCSCSGCISFRVADDLFFKQIESALFVRVCFYLTSFVFCQGCVGLRQYGFEWTWINLEKKVTNFYDAPLSVI